MRKCKSSVLAPGGTQRAGYRLVYRGRRLETWITSVGRGRAHDFTLRRQLSNRQSGLRRCRPVTSAVLRVLPDLNPVGDLKGDPAGLDAFMGLM
jgi:hypothetical protein